MTTKFKLSLVLATLLTTTAANLLAQNWTQWRGENREGVVKQAGLNLDWTQKKPPLMWTFRQGGAGYAAAVVSGTTLYGQGSADGSDFAFALDTRTGALKWKENLGEEFVESRGNGPRGSITVDGDKLYLIRGNGDLHCLSAATGKQIWRKELRKDLDGAIMSGWGYSESPLIDGNLLVCTPGGSSGTMAALDKNTGAVVWRSAEWTDAAGYSSPIVVEVNGVRQYIQQAAKGVAGVSPKDGKLLWKADVEGYRIAVVPTPVYHDNMVFVTSGYNAGCALVKLTKEGDGFKAELVYANTNMVNHHGGVFLLNGHVYGFSDASGWVCLNMKTGEQVWTQRRDVVGKGAVLGVNDRMILLEERSGLMVLVAASPEGWKEYGRIEMPERSTVETRDRAAWTHPVVADGKLFLRDQDLLFCFDMK